jgi:ribosomal protein L24
MDLRKYVKFQIKAMQPQLQRPKTQNLKLPFLSLTKHFSKFPALKLKQEKLAPIDYAKHLCLQKGDLVRILYGRYAGHHGRLLEIKDNMVSVSGCEQIRQSEGTTYSLRNDKINILNVVPIDPVLKRPTRIKMRVNMFGKKIRLSKLSRCAMPDNRKLVPDNTNPPNPTQANSKPIKSQSPMPVTKGSALHIISKRIAQMSK